MNTTPVSFRFSPEIKQLLALAAEQQHRSQTNFLELLIISHCQKNDIRVDPNKKVSVSEMSVNKTSQNN